MVSKTNPCGLGVFGPHFADHLDLDNVFDLMQDPVGEFGAEGSFRMPLALCLGA